MRSNVLFKVLEHVGIQIEEFIQSVLGHAHACDALGHGQQPRRRDKTPGLAGDKLVRSTGFWMGSTVFFTLLRFHVQQRTIEVSRFDGRNAIAFRRLSCMTQHLSEVRFQMVNTGLNRSRTNRIQGADAIDHQFTGAIVV